MDLEFVNPFTKNRGKVGGYVERWGKVGYSSVRTFFGQASDTSKYNACCFLASTSM